MILNRLREKEIMTDLLKALRLAVDVKTAAESQFFTELNTTFLAIKDRVFTNPQITNFVFAFKSGEYNDEGMYPGIFGPSFNVAIKDVAEDRYEIIDSLGCYGGYTSSHEGEFKVECALLSNLFSLVDAASLGEVLGSGSYHSEEGLLVVTRNGIENIYAGW
jgi:hypothetical protein